MHKGTVQIWIDGVDFLSNLACWIADDHLSEVSRALKYYCHIHANMMLELWMVVKVDLAHTTGLRLSNTITLASNYLGITFDQLVDIRRRRW